MLLRKVIVIILSISLIAAIWIFWSVAVALVLIAIDGCIQDCPPRASTWKDPFLLIGFFVPPVLLTVLVANRASRIIARKSGD